MICTFGDVTDVTWWRELSLPVRAVLLPDGRFRSIAWGAGEWETTDPARAQEAYDQVAGLSAQKARAKIVELLARERRSARRAASDHAPGEVLREGRSAARDHHQPAVVHQDHRVPRGADRARPRADVAAAVHAVALRELGRGPERRLVRQPSALLRRAVSRSGIRWRGDGRVLYDRAIVATEDQLPIDPSTDVPAGYTAEQRDQPNGFTGDPDVMDTWATSSLTPQIAGEWADDPDLFARVFPMDLRPQAHDIIRTWLFYTVARAHLEHGTRALDEHRDLGLGARSRPQEDVEIEGQRRHADGAARGARLRRRALLGGERTARHRHGVRSRADEGGPAAGDQAAERVEVRAWPGRAARCRSRRRSIAGMLTSLARLVADSTDAARRRTTTRRCSSAPSAGSGRSATITSSS